MAVGGSEAERGPAATTERYRATGGVDACSSPHTSLSSSQAPAAHYHCPCSQLAARLQLLTTIVYAIVSAAGVQEPGRLQHLRWHASFAYTTNSDTYVPESFGHFVLNCAMIASTCDSVPQFLSSTKESCGSSTSRSSHVSVISPSFSLQKCSGAVVVCVCACAHTPASLSLLYVCVCLYRICIYIYIFLGFRGLGFIGFWVLGMGFLD